MRAARRGLTKATARAQTACETGSGAKAFGPTRAARLAKAGRRCVRLRLLRVPAKDRGRLFKAAVLPVALYGSEHGPVLPGEFRQLTREAIQHAGLATPGVPFALLRACLPEAGDPQWKLAWASIERWAREGWYISSRARGVRVQGDVLPNDVWELVHMRWLKVESGELAVEELSLIHI